MEEFDDKLPKRKFDNFQFVPYYETMQKADIVDIFGNFLFQDKYVME